MFSVLPEVIWSFEFPGDHRS